MECADFPNAIFAGNAFIDTPITYANLPKARTITGSFENCKNLSSVNIPSVRTIGSNTFLGCISLTQDLILSNLTTLNTKAFANSYFKSIILPKCNYIQGYDFDGAATETIKLGEITKVLPYTFNNCANLKIVYMPSVTTINSCAFENCTSMETLFVPQCEVLPTDIPSNVTVYLNDLWYSLSNSHRKIYTIVAPIDSDSYESAIAKGYNFIDSYSMVNKKGASIRIYNPGLRFGFDWNELNTLETLADNVKYGFLYSYSFNEDMEEKYNFIVGTTQTKTQNATNRINENHKTRFNLVFNHIPISEYDTVIYARAYVCIDGMYFYSKILKHSFNSVAKAVLEDDNIDITTKNAVKELLPQEV